MKVVASWEGIWSRTNTKGICKGKDINATHFDTMDYAEYNEAVLALSAEKLAGVKNWIEFSSPTEGATITKIEILDLAE